MTTGTLFVGSTPIGNPEDFSLRLIRLLKECDLLIVENASKIFPILDKANIDYNKNYLEFRDPGHLETMESVADSKDLAIHAVLNYLDSNKNVLFICDEGTPLITDPGTDMLRHVALANYKIETVPGPSVVLASFIHGMALSSAGSSPGFLYLPSIWSKEDIIKTLIPIKNIEQSIILTANSDLFLYENPSKHFLDILGNRDVVVCQNLTHETQRIFKTNLEMLDNLIKGQIDFLNVDTTIFIYPR